jgi:Resolvase, N terminal domain
MLIGYARISTFDQTLALQQDALTAAGCEHIYTDTVSGSVTNRPGLTQALSHLRSGDTLVVWRLDRLGRSLPHLIETVRQLQDRGVGFRSLQEHIDTTTSGGKLVFHVFGALAEFERDLIRERTHAGLVAARARGRLFVLEVPSEIIMTVCYHDLHAEVNALIANSHAVSGNQLFHFCLVLATERAGIGGLTAWHVVVSGTWHGRQCPQGRNPRWFPDAR